MSLVPGLLYIRGGIFLLLQLQKFGQFTGKLNFSFRLNNGMISNWPRTAFKTMYFKIPSKFFRHFCCSKMALKPQNTVVVCSSAIWLEGGGGGVRTPPPPAKNFTTEKLIFSQWNHVFCLSSTSLRDFSFDTLTGET